MLDNKIIEQLIELGEAIEVNNPNLERKVVQVKKYEFVNVLGPEDCRKIAEKLTVDELCFFIKAIVEAENVNKWVGGSVASAIWLFRELQKVNLSKSIELANWILPRTENYYLPFGFNNHNAKSYDEYIELSKMENEQIDKSMKAQKIQEEVALQEREKRKQQRKLSNEFRKTEEWEKKGELLNKLTTQEQLKYIAADDQYSISFFPTSLIKNFNDESIKLLEKEVAIALLKKLKGRHKGPWGTFKRRLIEIRFNGEKLPWDRKPWHSY